jgi:hypothetical protein
LKEGASKPGGSLEQAESSLFFPASAPVSFPAPAAPVGQQDQFQDNNLKKHHVLLKQKIIMEVQSAERPAVPRAVPGAKVFPEQAA